MPGDVFHRILDMNGDFPPRRVALLRTANGPSVAHPTGGERPPCRRISRDRGRMGVRTADDAVLTPENAPRRFVELVRWGILFQTAGG